MDRRGAWRDEAFVKKLWRSFKYDELYLHGEDSVGEAGTSLDRSFYG